MAYNRKIRKFEGTCYIPGEQLAMMAKYYRGANLNLNLTLFEDDLSTLQETLDQACWCSKLDEVDRMKMAHMKGNEWRIAHEHCVEQGGRDPKVYPALPQSSKSTVGRVERGTSAVSLYERERGFERGGRYQRDDGYEPRNYYERKSRRTEYNEPSNRRSYYSDPRTRDDYDARYQREYPGPPVHDTQMRNEKRSGRNTGAPSDQRYDVESEAVSSMPEAPGEIRCAVCNAETCMVCKNHLYSPLCQCRCPVANAGLCNRCNQEPCEEEEQVGPETKGNKTDLSSLMLTMMMSSMLKQRQAPDSVCCCKPSRDHSDSSSSDSSDGKVHKIYLYDCEDTKKSKKSTKKSRKATSDSSSACDCCKCSRKPKKNSDNKGKPTIRGEETSDSDAGPKRGSSKGKGSKDGNRQSKGGVSDSVSDAKPKGSKDSDRKSTAGNSKTSKSSKEEDAKSNTSDNMKPSKMKNDNATSLNSSKGKTRESKAQGSISDSKNVQFSNTGRTPEPGAPRSSPSPQNLSFADGKPEKQINQTLDTPRDMPDPEPSNHTKKDDTEGSGEESSATFHLREFIVCLPKIQSNLQSLMYKLNQMDLNNQLRYQTVDATVPNARFHMRGMPACPDVPLISSPQIPLHNTSGSLYDDHPRMNDLNRTQDSEISLGFSPGNLPDQSMLPTIPSGLSAQTPLNPSSRYHSNSSNLKPIKTSSGGRNQVDQAPEFARAPERTQPAFEISLTGKGARTKDDQCQNGISSPLTTRKPSDKIRQHPKMHESTGNGVQPQRKKSPTSCYSSIEHFKTNENKSGDQSGSPFKRQGREVHKGNNAVSTSSQYGGDTVFKSLNRETSTGMTVQDLTDYASFSEENNFQLSPAPSAQQGSNMKRNVTNEKVKLGISCGQAKLSEEQASIISKCSRSNRQDRALRKTRSVLKPSRRVTFKVKSRSPLSLEKLVQGCTVQGSRGERGQTRSNFEEKADFIGSPNRKRLEQGVGPGKFRRSKSDSSLELSGNTSKNNFESPVRPKTPKTPSQKRKAATPAPTGKQTEVIPLKKKRSASPIGKATHTMAVKKKDLDPATKDSPAFGVVGLRNIPSDQTADRSDSIWKMSDAYVRQEVDSQSYIVSSVEVKTINNNGTSADIFRMVQGIAAKSVTSVPHPTAPMSSEELDILPLLPLSPTDSAGGSESIREDQTRGVVANKHVSFDNKITPDTPAFLRKSRVQVEQLKRAHETIRSMIKNVNEVIAHIDSDSNFGIGSKARNEDKERQSYFVHLDDENKRPIHYKPDVKIGQNQSKAGSSFNKQNREAQKMFLTVDRVLNSVLTPSDQSNVTPESNPGNTTPSRAHRDYFILNSDSSSTAFTESLRRSLENDASRSVPLTTQPALSFQHGTSQRRQSTRPLKRRSWFPHPKR